MLDNEFLSKNNAAGLSNFNWNSHAHLQGTIYSTKSNNNYQNGWRIISTTTKTTYETPLPEPIGHDFFRCKAQRGDLVSEVSNVTVVEIVNV